MTLGRQPLLIGAACLVVVAAGLTTWLIKQDDCRVHDEVVAAGAVKSPFSTTPSDAHTRRLASASKAWGLGEVIGSYGFDYGQQLSVAAVGGDQPALLTWVKRDPVMAVLSDTGADLKPAWGLRQDDVRRTWDASTTDFVTVTAPSSGAEVSSYRLADGRRDWCQRLDHEQVGKADSIATSVLADGSVVVASGGDSVDVTRLAGKDGSSQWHQVVKVRRGDSLAAASPDVLVLGSGSPAAVADGKRSKVAATVVGLDAENGKTLWKHEPGAGVWSQVVGQDDTRTVLLEQGAGSMHLVALDSATGEQAWQTTVPVSASPDATVRDGVVINRTPTQLAGYDSSDGDLLWERPIRQQPQYFPYGFELGQAPSVAGGVLLGGTDALHLMNPKFGSVRDLALPTDGINTTWWPYQVVGGVHSLTVVTNTGAVVLGS